MLDVIACVPDPRQRQLCYCGPLDAVSAIENLLLIVGGQNSPRFNVLQERLSQIHPQNKMPRAMSFVLPKSKAEVYNTPTPGSTSDSSTENDVGYPPVAATAAAAAMARIPPLQLSGQISSLKGWAVDGWLEDDQRHGSFCEHRIEDLN